MSKKPVDPAATNVFAAGITIDPNTNVLTLNPNDTFDETITVTIPQGGAAGVANVKLVPSATIAPFITSITPAVVAGPLSGREEHKLPFEVKFHGIPCKTEQQVISGTIDVVIASATGAGGQVVASKKVQITVPACAVERLFVYPVKFVCGVQSECACECAPVQPGRYATEINIHNYSSKEVRIHKRFIPVVLAGAAGGRRHCRAGVWRAADHYRSAGGCGAPLRTPVGAALSVRDAGGGVRPA